MAPNMTTREWQLMVEWKDGCTNCVPFKDINIYHTIEVARFSTSNRIEEEPNFN